MWSITPRMNTLQCCYAQYPLDAYSLAFQDGVRSSPNRTSSPPEVIPHTEYHEMLETGAIGLVSLHETSCPIDASFHATTGKVTKHTCYWNCPFNLQLSLEIIELDEVLLRYTKSVSIKTLNVQSTSSHTAREIPCLRMA